MERGALDGCCWRCVGREECRERAPPTGRDRKEEEGGKVMKLMVRGGGQSLCGMDGEMDAGGRRRGIVQADLFLMEDLNLYLL